MLAAGLGGFLLEKASAQDPAWHVEDAPIRYKLEIQRRPTHASAGFFVELPDGGLLPGPAVETVVFSAGGRPLDSYVLWHSPARNISLVFADVPHGEREVVVYLRPAPRYRSWTPESGLTPSAILTTDPTQGSLEAARALARLGRVPERVHHINQAGHSRAPLSIGGDHAGRPRPASFYMLAHVVSADPGRTWVAPFAVSGSGDVRINGQTLNLQKRIDKWGGTGDWADIKPGPNRIEIFHAAGGSGPFSSDARSGGLVYMTWRTPKATMAELGGVRSENVPMSGTSRMETRIIRDNEIMRSGECSVAFAEARDGRPVAQIRHAPAKVFWLGNEPPLLVYEFKALKRGHPKDTVYTWTLDDGITVEGETLPWIFTGMRDQRISLTAVSAAGRTTAVMPFFAATRRATSLDNADDRRDYRVALWNMVKAYPRGHASVARWDPAFWGHLVRTMEFGKGYPLLRDLFDKHYDVLRANLQAEDLAWFEDLFLDTAIRLNPGHSLEWIRAFSNVTKDPGRKHQLSVRAAEVHMHYLRDFETAEKVLGSIARPEDSVGQRLVRVRLGDLALLKGDLNLATRYYADVQNLVRLERSRGGAIRRTDDKATEVRRAGRGDWRMRALLDASASESVRSLLKQESDLEAREALRNWELNMPLSKISGDFILLEATLYRRVPDPVRAVSLLRAFCDTVEASNYLPEAAPLLLNLLRESGEEPSVIRQTGERLRKLLEYHPVARDLEHLTPDAPDAPAGGENDV